MPEQQYTRCPGCKTIFRVTSAQLAIRAGQVRCGHCKTVFDGIAQLISLAPRPQREEGDAVDEAALGPPTVTLRHAHALETAARDEPRREPTAPGELPDVGGNAEPVAEIAYEERFAWAGRKKRQRRVAGPIYTLAVPLLLLLLAGQAIFHFRDAVAARWPAARPLLTSVCATAGCAIRPPRASGDELRMIVGSDLQADPAHKGLLILTATLRNPAGWAVEYPYLELQLTDAQDRIVVQRALTPAEYAGGTADLATGIPADAEVAVKLFIDASATVQAGYKLYLFYP